VIDLEPKADVEEIHVGANEIDMEGVEDIDVEGSDPISKVPEYIPLLRGKTKFLKDIDGTKVTLHTPLLPNQFIF